METNKNEYDVFISYRHATGFYMANIIFNKLVYDGYSVFMDKTMDCGKYPEKIKDAISKSKNFLVVLFPGDLDSCNKENDWLTKEAQWALETDNINIVPVLCDGYSPTDTEIPGKMKGILSNQGITIHKDYSLDMDIDRLRDKFLKNVNPIKSQGTVDDYFDINLNNDNLNVVSVDLAFHAGDKWLRPGKRFKDLKKIVERKIPLRVIINTDEAAESIARYMRDEDASYTPFSEVRNKWKKWMEKYSDTLEVRVCEIPLIHIYHSIVLKDEDKDKVYGKLHIKYYAYNNTDLDDAFCHEISNYSSYYEVYKKEFEFLWENSTPVTEWNEVC